MKLPLLPPAITKAPVGKNFNKGENITLTVEATGATPFTYQWFKSKKLIPGATSSSYTINNADVTASGDYSVKVDNANGAANTFTSDNSGRLIMNGATLNIEGEDFNYDGGKTLPVASVAPYTGDAYKSLIPVADVDFMDAPDESGGAAFSYTRFKATDPYVIEMKGPADPADYNRGSWTVTANYAVGWSSPGDWQNYTRTFPKGRTWSLLERHTTSLMVWMWEQYVTKRQGRRR